MAKVKLTVDSSGFNAAMNAASARLVDFQRKGGSMGNTVKDLFSPMSMGAASKLGGIGVMVAGAKLALDTYKNKALELSELEYLTPSQRAQLKDIHDGMSGIGDATNKMVASVMISLDKFNTAVADTLSGDGGGMGAAQRMASQKTAELDKYNRARKIETQQETIARLRREAAELPVGEKKGALEKQAEEMQRAIWADKQKAFEELTKKEYAAEEKKRAAIKKTADEQKRLDEEKQARAAEDFDFLETGFEQQEKERADAMRSEQEDTLKKLRERRDILREQAARAADQGTAKERLAGALKAQALRAAGDDKGAAAIEREMGIRSRASDIAAQTGMGLGQARAIAAREFLLQDKIDQRGEETTRTGRRKIKGYSRAQYEAAGHHTSLTGSEMGGRMAKGSDEAVGVLREILQKLTVE